MTGGAPLVSVVVPFLNVAPYLAEAIESVRAQRYEHWELLLCDDGATDGASDIAERYAELDPERIRHLRHDGGAHLGASAARNLGLRHARGSLIALLDGDDVWLPHKLAEQVALLREHPEADALYGLTELWHSWTGVPEDKSRDVVPPSGVASGTLLPRRALLEGMLTRDVLVPCTCSIVMRADAVRRSGGFANEFPGIYDDVAFYSRLSLVASVLFVDRCWDRYRQHPASTYAGVKRRGEGQEARKRYLEWLGKYLRQTDARDDRKLRRALFVAKMRVRYPRLLRAIERRA
ncbi:MAG TPA: glycosyltransferase family 2 protein [Gemmatimonadaceae bacterium]|nr:glycosyltransferase family 2 protein [Gemmatimonadaceae bacterium]